MTEDTDFKITEDKLNPDKRVYPHIIFENDYYTARFYYMVDYMKDKDNKMIDISKTAAVIKTKDPYFNGFNIRLMTEKFITAVSSGVILDSDRCYDDFEKYLRKSKISCENLNKLFYEYFIQYTP